MSATTLKILQGELAGLDDAELQRARTRPLTYTLVLPGTASAERPAKGLFVYIAGFGDDANDAYTLNLLSSMAEEFGYAGLTVRYHCCQSRHNNGAGIQLMPDSEERLMGLCAIFGVAFNPNDLLSTLEQFSNTGHATLLRGQYLPPDGEYQNFGVLQAIDHLCVISDLMAEGVPFDRNNIVLTGSSHGGYIAHLMAKFAPNTINAVIDNSSYVRAPLTYLGLGPGELVMQFNQLQLGLSVITPWQFSEPTHPTFYGVPQALIRQTCNAAHMATMAQAAQRRPVFHAFNAAVDHISPIDDKRRQHRRYLAHGFESHLQEITEADVDGKRFKTMAHGMNASMKTLARDLLPHIEPRPTTTDWERETTLDFDCLDSMYHIRHVPTAPYMSLAITPRD